MNIDKIIKPINTEKTMMLMEKGIYSFLVDKSLNKESIREIVQKTFKVEVESVKVLNRAGKTKMFRGIKGKMSDEKRAFVKVKEGKIDFEGGF